MDEKIVSLSEAVSRLLSENNKNKSLGELSEDLNSYLIEIKELVDSGGISFEQLREEISKHINLEEPNLPGSIKQLLIGCIGGEEGSCPVKSEEPENVPFAYDSNLKKIVPLSKYVKPITGDTYAVLYLTGNPLNIDVSSLKELEEAGFKKLKIEYKEISNADYKTINIENLKKYIYEKPEGDKFNGYMILTLLFAIFLLIYIIKK